MHISSKGDLIKLINEFAVETFPVDSGEGTRIFNTIIQNKEERHYRLKWGEVSDDNMIDHLWFEKDLDEVFLNSSEIAPGWKTKKEIAKLKLAESRLRDIYQMNDCILYNVEKNIVGVKNPTDWRDDNLTVIGSGPGGGKTEYAIGKTARAIINNKSVLFFSTSNSKEEIERRLLRTMTLKVHDKFENRETIAVKDISELSEASKVIENAKLIIDDTFLIDDKYIARKMREVSKSKNGLDLVVIDYLQMVLSNNGLNNYDEVVKVHKSLDKIASELGCKVLVTTHIQDL